MSQQELLRRAYEFAKESPDPSTQNGALIVDDSGYSYSRGVNEFPIGILPTAERLVRPLKYKFIEHAERNAIYLAAREKVLTRGMTMVCPWAPCCDCARAIIQAGIFTLITHKQAYDLSPERWKEDIDLALGMLKEAGVKVEMYDGPIGVRGVRFNGDLWNP